MNSGIYFLYALLLFAGFLIYFKIATTYKIVDLPNHRSMHQGSTIRGGGIVILIAVALYSIFTNMPGSYFFGGLVLVGITGFLDDLVDLSGRIRIPLQALSVIMMLVDLHLLDLPFLQLVMVVIVVTGVLNAFNFMDGINGMTGGYSLVTLGSLLYVNQQINYFIANDFLYFTILTLLVFIFFNFRIRAVCFAGDVGSLSIAFIIVYLIIRLVNETHNISYLLFLTLYGIDTVFTIIHRLMLRQNIFKAHRLHLYQVWVSKTGMPHLWMSSLYMFIQLAINVIVIAIIPIAFHQQMIYLGILLMMLSILYIIIKSKMIPNSL